MGLGLGCGGTVLLFAFIMLLTALKALVFVLQSDLHSRRHEEHPDW